MKIIISLIILLCSFVQPISSFASAIPVEHTVRIQYKKQIKQQKPFAIHDKNLHPIETFLIVIISLLAIWLLTGLTLLIVGLVLSLPALWITGTVLLGVLVAIFLAIIISIAITSKATKETAS